MHSQGSEVVTKLGAVKCISYYFFEANAIISIAAINAAESMLKNGKVINPSRFK